MHASIYLLRPSDNIVYMDKIRINPVDTLARNLQILMELEGIDQVPLAKRSGVSQKTISNMLNAKTSPNLDKVDAVAAAFGLNLWHLIMPNLPRELISGGEIERLYQNFIKADGKGRDYVMHVAEREATYKDSNRH